MKVVIGIILAFTIGIICRLSGIPVPAPPVIVGALLVVAMTVGYIFADKMSKQLSNKYSNNCSHPKDETSSDEAKNNV
jgi:XapX domain-containing protein